MGKLVKIVGKLVVCEIATLLTECSLSLWTLNKLVKSFDNETVNTYSDLFPVGIINVHATNPSCDIKPGWCTDIH